MSDRTQVMMAIKEITEHLDAHPEHEVALVVVATIDPETGEVWRREHSFASMEVMSGLIGELAANEVLDKILGWMARQAGAEDCEDGLMEAGRSSRR